MLNLGLTQWFLDVEAADSIARAKDLGFAYLHIASFAPGDKLYIGEAKVLQHYKSQTKRTGVAITAISLSPYEEYHIPLATLNFENHSLWQIVIDSIKAAKILNIELIYLPSFNLAQIKNISDIEATAQILNHICQHARSHGICVANENTLGAVEVALLLLQCNDAVQILLDTQNPLVHGHAIETIINKVKRRIASQVHIKDGDKYTLGNARLGTGSSGLRDTLLMLNDMHREFKYIFENDYREDAERKSQEDMQNFRRIMQEIRQS